MLFRMLKLVMAPFVRLFGRPVVTGRAYVPRRGPVILAGNHLSFSDSLFLILVLRRRVTFLAKNEYFTGRGVRGRLMSWFFTSAGQIPVDRRHAGRAAGGRPPAKVIH